MPGHCENRLSQALVWVWWHGGVSHRFTFWELAVVKGTSEDIEWQMYSSENPSETNQDAFL
jgi:hypothetical protein